MPRKRKGCPIHGWLAVNKPKGLTSTACVGWLKRLYSPQKIGHGGTLDPLAEGLLPIAFGEATKTIPWIMDANKTYRFSIIWGENRSTLDAEGTVTAQSDTQPHREAISQALQTFTGAQLQTPPEFSAIKINGKRAYELARAGKAVTPAPRPVLLKKAKILEFGQGTTKFEIQTGKGYYVRALARDLAAALGAMGYVGWLQRRSVGTFTLDNTPTPDIIESMDRTDRENALLPIDHVLTGLPVISIKPELVKIIRNGQAAPLDAVQDTVIEKCLARSGETPIALGRVAQNFFYPKKVFML